MGTLQSVSQIHARGRTGPRLRDRLPGCGTLALTLLAAVLATAPAHAASVDAKPYDDRLFRLSEILGAVHYLRELCGADEGQLWRQRMSELLQAEGYSALRRAQADAQLQQGLP